MSADGTIVAFNSIATNLVPNDANGQQDVFVYNRRNKTARRASVASDGTEANSSSALPSLSADGHFVLFSSGAENFFPGDTNNAYDIFIADLLSGSVERANVPQVGTVANGISNSFAISGDGRFSVFTSLATNLIAGDSNDQNDVFVFDRLTKAIARVNIANDGSQANGLSNFASISSDGRYVTFESVASNLVRGDTPGSTELFIVANPLFGSEQAVTVQPGDAITGMDFGLLPKPGAISGRLFEDNIIANGVYDSGEGVFSGHTVYIDENRNGTLTSLSFRRLRTAMAAIVFRRFPHLGRL